MRIFQTGFAFTSEPNYHLILCCGIQEKVWDVLLKLNYCRNCKPVQILHPATPSEPWACKFEKETEFTDKISTY